SAHASWGQCRIVVEQKQVSTFRDSRGLVASSSEALIDGVAKNADVLEAFEESVRVVMRSVVDDDELVCDVGVAQNGFETAIGVRHTVVGQYHNGHSRLGGASKAQPGRGVTKEVRKTRMSVPLELSSHASCELSIGGGRRASASRYRCGDEPCDNPH